jgi:large subunit ribosomal protein L9
MKIILQKDIKKLGKKFDIKDVNSGHALNLLIPQGLAVPATPDAIKKAQADKIKHEGEMKVHLDLLLKNIKDLEGVSISISGKANEKGHLFAGIHKEEIAEQLQKQTKLQINPSFIELDHPIKELGEHIIKVSGSGKNTTFKVNIEATK